MNEIKEALRKGRISLEWGLEQPTGCSHYMWYVAYSVGPTTGKKYYPTMEAAVEKYEINKSIFYKATLDPVLTVC